MPAAFLFYKKALDPYEIQDNYVWKQFYVPLHIRKTNWLLFGEKSACVGCITVFMEVPGNSSALMFPTLKFIVQARLIGDLFSAIMISGRLQAG